MDIDPEGEPPHDEHVPPVAPEAAPVTAPTTFTPPESRSGRRFIPFALLGIMTIGTALAAFFAVSESSTPSEAVPSALTNSLQFKSAATTVSIGVKEAGGTATITSSRSSAATSASTNALSAMDRRSTSTSMGASSPKSWLESRGYRYQVGNQRPAA